MLEQFEILFSHEGLWDSAFGLAFLLCGIYLAHLAVYFASGYALTWINHRNPARKIQTKQSRVPAFREIKQSFISLLATSLCFLLALLISIKDWGVNSAVIDYFSLTGLFSVLGYFLLAALFGDLWFYIEHRLAHTKWLIRIHREHHLSPVPTPWTNDRFSFFEVILIQVYMVVLAFFTPIPFEILIVYRIYDQIKGMIGHCGYEYFEGAWARWPSPFACVGYHDAHHEKFSVNYGNLLTVWDRLFGTIEPDYDKKVVAVTEKYKQL